MFPLFSSRRGSVLRHRIRRRSFQINVLNSRSLTFLRRVKCISSVHLISRSNRIPNRVLLLLYRVARFQLTRVVRRALTRRIRRMVRRSLLLLSTRNNGRLTPLLRVISITRVKRTRRRSRRVRVLTIFVTEIRLFRHVIPITINSSNSTIN